MKPRADSIYLKGLHAKLRSYWRVWLRLTAQQFESQVANARGAAIVFILGKVFRLVTAFAMVYIIVGRAKALAGYNLQEAVFILAVFNLISTISQLFFRGVYMFRQKVQDGTFDFYLLNPLSELFYSLFSYTDPLDLLLVIPYTFVMLWAWLVAGYTISAVSLLYLFIAILIALVIVAAIHILVISIGVRYMEVDNTIMLYRDLERMAAFPVSMYGRIGEAVLTYILPLAIMATVPANLIFNLANPYSLVLFSVIALIELKLALWYWHRSLLTYSSASS